MSRPQLPCCESKQDLFEQHRLFKAKICRSVLEQIYEPERKGAWRGHKHTQYLALTMEVNFYKDSWICFKNG